MLRVRCYFSILWSIALRGQGSLELGSRELSWVLIFGPSGLEGVCTERRFQCFVGGILLCSTRLARIEGVVTEIQRELNEVKVLSDSHPPKSSDTTRSGRGVPALAAMQHARITEVLRSPGRSPLCWLPLWHMWASVSSCMWQGA